MENDPFDAFIKHQQMQTFKVGAAMEMVADLPLILAPIYGIDDWYHSRTLTPRVFVENYLKETENAKSS